MEDFSISGDSSSRNVLVWVSSPQTQGECDSFARLVAQKSGSGDFMLLSVFAQNWNDDLSPWSCTDGKNAFAGNAPRFLQKLLGVVEESCAQREGGAQSRKFVLGGYSLAGLFALWAASQTPLFCAAASCSGSLWFPSFAEKAAPPQCKSVYLSLGDKEAQTKHPLMRNVQAATAAYFERLEASGKYEHLRFELNAGGHFAQPLERTAKGFAAALEFV